MDCSNIKRILFILLCCFIIFFPFWCVRGLCAELEEVSFDTVPNLTITGTANYFTSSTGSVGYIELEQGYIYHFHNNNPNTVRGIALSDSIPELNGTYQFLIGLEGGGDYSYLCTSSNTYIYIDFSAGSGSAISVTREKLTDMNGAVIELANVVSPNAFWNIFDISINYIVVVVVFGLGCFIIFKLIKKLSKGNEGF